MLVPTLLMIDPLREPVRVGVNIADLAGELSRSPGMESRTTFVAGIAARRSISEVFEIQPEVLYSQKGAKYSFTTGPGPGGVPGQTYHVTEELDYIDLPILLKIGLPKTPSVSPALLLGPSIGFFLTGKLNTSPSGPDEDPAVNSLDLGIVLGLELQNGAYHGFVLDARYTRSLKTISELQATTSIQQTGQGGTSELLNSVISVSLGVH